MKGELVERASFKTRENAEGLGCHQRQDTAMMIPAQEQETG